MVGRWCDWLWIFLKKKEDKQEFLEKGKVEPKKEGKKKSNYVNLCD